MKLIHTMYTSKISIDLRQNVKVKNTFADIVYNVLVVKES